MAWRKSEPLIFELDLIDYRCILTLECFIVLLGGATVDVNFVASTEPSKNTKRKSDNSKVRKNSLFVRQQIQSDSLTFGDFKIFFEGSDATEPKFSQNLQNQNLMMQKKSSKKIDSQGNCTGKSSSRGFDPILKIDRYLLVTFTDFLRGWVLLNPNLPKNSNIFLR